MNVLAFVNQKGGCGKTTTAINLAGAFAASGERTLLVDLDPQAHATLGLGCATDGEATIFDVFCERLPLERVIQHAPGGIHIAPASLALGDFEEAAVHMVGPERRLERALEPLARLYDRVLVDCPPRVDGVLTQNALRACDTAMLVVECGAFALQGALRTRQILREVALGTGTREPRLRVVGTLFERETLLARELLIALQSRFGAALLETVLATSVRLRETAACGLPIQVLDPECPAAGQFAELAQEIRADLQNNELLPLAAAATR